MMIPVQVNQQTTDWACPRCHMTFGRKSAHQPETTRCDEFLAAYELYAADYVPAQDGLALFTSKYAPNLSIYKRCALSRNDKTRSYAWVPRWFKCLFESYSNRKNDDFAYRMLGAAVADDYEESANPNDRKLLPQIIPLVATNTELQEAILSIATLGGETRAVFDFAVELLFNGR